MPVDDYHERSNCKQTFESPQQALSKACLLVISLFAFDTAQHNTRVLIYRTDVCHTDFHSKYATN